MLSEKFTSATYCLIIAENNMSSRNVNAGLQDATTIQVPKKILSVALAVCTTMSASIAMAADAPISLNAATVSASAATLHPKTARGCGCTFRSFRTSCTPEYTVAKFDLGIGPEIVRI